MPLVEDTSVYFNVAEFGRAATLNGSVTTTGIFDDAFVDALGVAATGPTFLCDLLGVLYGDALVVSGKGSYKVVGAEPDGTGLTLLRLERQ